MSDTMKKVQAAARKLTGIKPVGHGPFFEADDTWVDPKPYTEVYANGLFEGYDGTLWLYFGFPHDIRIEWLKNSAEAVYNQHFIVDMVDRLADMMNGQVAKTRRDERRDFHIHITRDDFHGIDHYSGITPAHADFLDRMSERYTKPEWFGYFGVKLKASSINYEAYGLKAKVERYVETFKNPELLQMELFRQDIDEVTALMSESGFRPLDLERNLDDLEHLTAWHGISDDDYAMPRQLVTTRFQEPLHGKSLITPKFGEISAYAVVPQPGVFMVDPRSEHARWGKGLYRPGSNVVCVSIRGQIRAPRNTEELFDTKRLVKAEAAHQSKRDSLADRERTASEVSKAERARSAASAGHGMLDNMEIIVFTTVTPGQKNPLPDILGKYHLNPVILEGRQPAALNASMPTYPRPVMIPKPGNKTRAALSNQMYAGALAMSGLFRATKPAASRGIVVGLSDGGYEYIPVMTGIESANEKNSVPGMLVTGRPGAGKALSLDTEIMSPTGPIRMGDVKVGDLVFGSDGKPCQVTFVTPIQHDREVYRVTLSDGQSFLADRDHQWLMSSYIDRYGTTVEIAAEKAMVSDIQVKLLTEEAESQPVGKTLSGRQVGLRAIEVLGDYTPWTALNAWRSALEFVDCPYTSPDGRTRMYDARTAFYKLAERMEQRRPVVIADQVTRRVTTGELLAQMETLPNQTWSVPVTDGVGYPEQDLPLDPYVLGAWLGDGETHGHRIAAASVGLGVDPETGLTDMDSMLEQLKEFAPTVKDDYAIATHGLAPRLREIGVLHDKHIPEQYMRASREQRLALLQGLMDTDGGNCSNGYEVAFSNTNLRLVEQTVELARSLGIKVSWETCAECGYRCEHEYTMEEYDRKKPPTVNGREVHSRKACFGVAWTTELPMFRLPRKLNRQHRSPGKRTRSMFVRSVERVESVPVRCISVDSPDHSYMIGQGVVTSNTQEMLMIGEQAVYQGYNWFYLNPKGTGTLKPVFDYLGGLTVNMDARYLNENPGLMDPVFFLGDRNEVASMLGEAIQRSMRMNQDQGHTAAGIRANLMAELTERANDSRNRCSADIIFGNQAAGTLPISNQDVLNFVHNKMVASPFWKAFIAREVGGRSTDMQERMRSGKPVLIEWGGSMNMPSPEDRAEDYTDDQVDTVLSVTVAFKYAAEVVGFQSNGGLIEVDEAWVLKSSDQVMATLNKGLREWRQANIMIVLGTQELRDFLSGANSLPTYFGRYLIMAISQNSDEELDLYYKVTGLPRTEANTRYIIDAAVEPEDDAVDRYGRTLNQRPRNLVPKAYYVDRLHDWEGGILCGPWPTEELTLGRTDKRAVAERAAMEASASQYDYGTYGGILGAVARQDLAIDESYSVTDAG